MTFTVAEPAWGQEISLSKDGHITCCVTGMWKIDDATSLSPVYTSPSGRRYQVSDNRIIELR